MSEHKRPWMALFMSGNGKWQLVGYFSTAKAALKRAKPFGKVYRTINRDTYEVVEA